MPAEIALKAVLYRIEGMEDAVVERTPYTQGRQMDLYYPANRSTEPLPAVVIALGYRDVGIPLAFGCQFREMKMATSWAQLFAASQVISVVYESSNPSEDIHAVLNSIAHRAAALGIDPHCIA